MSEKAKREMAVAAAAKKINLQEIFGEESVGSRAIWLTLIDLVFACAPILLLIIPSVLSEKFSLIVLLGLSDWSLIATFLFGQSVVKIMQIPFDMFITRAPEIVAGAVALVICFGLVPSAVVFAMSSGVAAKTNAIIWGQMLFFVISILTYGWIAFVSNAATMLKSAVYGKITIGVAAEFNKMSENSSD